MKRELGKVPFSVCMPTEIETIRAVLFVLGLPDLKLDGYEDVLPVAETL